MIIPASQHAMFAMAFVPDSFETKMAITAGVMLLWLVLNAIYGLCNEETIPTIIVDEIRVSAQSEEGIYVLFGGRLRGFWNLVLYWIGENRIVLWVTHDAITLKRRYVRNETTDSMLLRNTAGINHGRARRNFGLILMAVLLWSATAALAWNVKADWLQEMLRSSFNLPYVTPANVALATAEAGLMAMVCFAFSQRHYFKVESNTGRIIGATLKSPLIGPAIKLETITKAAAITGSLIQENELAGTRRNDKASALSAGLSAHAAAGSVGEVN